MLRYERLLHPRHSENSLRGGSRILLDQGSNCATVARLAGPPPWVGLPNNGMGVAYQALALYTPWAVAYIHICAIPLGSSASFVASWNRGTALSCTPSSNMSKACQYCGMLPYLPRADMCVTGNCFSGAWRYRSAASVHHEPPVHALDLLLPPTLTHVCGEYKVHGPARTFAPRQTVSSRELLHRGQ